jgi:hypothetical protein
MYSKKLSFSTTQLSSNVVQSGQIPITITQPGLNNWTTTHDMYPRAMSFKNSTGQTIKFGLIDSAAQMIEYQNDVTNFELIAVANGDTWKNTDLYPLPLSKFLLVQSSGSITNALDVYFMNFA